MNLSGSYFKHALMSAVATVLLSISPLAMAQEPAPATPAAATEAAPAADAPKPEVAAEEAAAPAAGPEDPGKIAWMLTSSALVLMMTAPGLALFYGGLVRKKNILGVMMQCVFLMGLMSVVWAIIGYSWAFGGTTPYYGGFDRVMLADIIPSSTLTLEASTKPTIFCLFQGMFFIITPALICGAFAERMKFSAMCVFSVVWGLLVYCPIAHWVWSDNGWLNVFNKAASTPCYDLAGGTVVHISSGISALLCAIFLGKRIGFGKEPMPPHNLTYTCIGAALLWVGWFGFNGGSALAADKWAVNAFFATHLAAAAGVLGWAGAEWLFHGKPTILGACSGAVAGLVCITPAAGAVNPVQGIYLGLAAGIVCYLACTKVKNTFGYDDSLDAFGVHGVGGTLGALLTGVFASSAITEDKWGLIEGFSKGGDAAQAGIKQFTNQVIGVGCSIGLAVVGTFLILLILNAIMGLRVSADDEIQGLDVSQHGEEGYIFQ